MARLLVAIAFAVAGGCSIDAFRYQCTTSSQCVADGVCVDGACAYRSTDCQSGLRFDPSASMNRGSQCVGEVPDLSMTDNDMGSSETDLAGADLTPVDFTVESDLMCPSGFVPSASGCVWDDPSLSALSVSSGALEPAFASAATAYKVLVPITVQTFNVTPVVPRPNDATIDVDGVRLASGTTSASKSLPILGENTPIQIVVTAASGAMRTYQVIVLRGLAIDSYFKASNTSGGTPFGDEFGDTVAISGDWMVVGSPHEDSDGKGVDPDTQTNDMALESGAAYVFKRVGSTWMQNAYLKASNSEAGDRFGEHVAIDGDTIVVGAPGEDSNGQYVNPIGGEANNSADGAGAAYVFTPFGASWKQQAYLKASNTQGGDAFGDKVAVSGDTIVVGAIWESGSGTGVAPTSNESAGASGAAYVFARVGGSWMGPTYLKASNTATDDWFGFSVAISGDTIVVGAPMEDGDDGGSQGESGAIYVFERSSGTWGAPTRLKASNVGANDQLGWSVGIYGDTILAGAPGEASNGTGVNPNTKTDNSKAGSGAAYVFFRSGTWSEQAYLKSSNPEQDDRFGTSVAIYGDAAIIGAPKEDSNGTGINPSTQSNNAQADSGAAYFFTRSGSTWMNPVYLKAPNTDQGDAFGLYVSISADTIAISSYTEDSSRVGVNSTVPDNNDANDSGAVYTFRYKL